MAGTRMEVRSPDGRRWHVWREFPWPRWRASSGDAAMEDIVGGGPDAMLIDEPETLLFAPVLFVVLFPIIAAITWIFLPLFLFIVELVLVVAGVAFVLHGWRVVAETEGPPPHRLVRRVRGWRASNRAVATLAHEIETAPPRRPLDSPGG